MGDAQTAAEKTLANAVETGILKRNKVVPRLSDIRDRLESIVGKGVDLSIVKRSGKFDQGPYFPIRDRPAALCSDASMAAAAMAQVPRAPRDRDIVDRDRRALSLRRGTIV